MPKVTSMRAWDWTHDDLKHITHLGYQVEFTKAEVELHKALDSMSAMRLPIEAIYNIAHLVESAYNVGKERANG